jgi:hypothetical protein
MDGVGKLIDVVPRIQHRCAVGSQRLLHFFEPLLRMLQSRVLPSQRSIIVYLMRRHHVFSVY